MKKMLTGYRKYIVLCLALILLIGGIGIKKGSTESNAQNITAALLYDSDALSQQYIDTYSQLQHSFMANFEVAKVDIAKDSLNLNSYDLIYLDSSVAGKPDLKDKLLAFVEEGNSVFVPNELTTYFDLDFFGAKELVKIDSVPNGMVYNEVSGDISPIQEIIKDFSKVYENYEDYQYLSGLDYGYGFIPDSAVSIADYNGISLYGINNYGKGRVFYTNPLLPNSYQINGFSIEPRNDTQTHFTNSTATANQLILGEFASYVSKNKYGYSVKKVLGSFARPAMAWQLHYEEISAIENSSAIKFGEMCKEYNTIPSYTLIRNTYKWFSKYESISYLLNDNGSYYMDVRENAYSSGTHVVEGDDYLALYEAENTGSYFVDNYDFMQMAYPCVDDFNNDGTADIVSGSSDGKFYYFVGDSFNKEWKVADRQMLTDIDGYDLSIGSYSAPCMIDYDNDGILDMVSGSEQGDIYLFKGYDTTHFYKGEVILSIPQLNRAMPYVADLTGDGVPEIVVGSVDGQINIYKAQGDGSYSMISSIQCDNETFVAPYVYDYNQDNNLDLVYGTFDGYIRKLMNTGDLNFENDGFFDTDEINYKGNNHIKFGNNCVPRFFDINSDNKDDLIAGELEYGLAIPIDSPYFKYRNQLQEQVNYIKDNNYYLGLHFYTKEYSSEDREREELRLHKRAFDTYAIDYDDVGANLHTWRMSELSPRQTLISAKEAGLKWMSCLRATNSKATPDASAEFSLVSPFFLDFENKDFMVTNASVLTYRFDDFAYMSAKYDLPISEYYHCDFVYRNEDGGRYMIERVASYQKEHDYNFVREDQLIKGAAAAYNMLLETSMDKSGNLTLKASADGEDFPLYDKDYQDCVGVKIEFAESTNASNIGIDADVWSYDKDKNSLYVALNSEVKINFNDIGENGEFELIDSDESHILSVNIPADVKVKNNRATVKFEDDGMMQVTVSGEVKDCSGGWNVDYNNGISTITKFGSESDLSFEFAK